MTEIKKYKVVICGGGFAGVKTALELCGENNLEVVLLSDEDDFEYHASLYRTATGGSPAETLIPLSSIFEDKQVKIVKDSVEKLDRARKAVITKSGKKINFDILVLALGSATNYFNISGLKKYSYGLKNYQEAIKFKQHLHNQLTANHKPDFNYVVVGGGSTGVELASALPLYIKKLMRQHQLKDRKVSIDLIEAEPRILPSMPKSLSRAVARRLRRLGVHILTGRKVSGETADNLMVDGKEIKSTTVIWTAGITNHPFFTKNHFSLTARGRVAVNEFLEAEPDIYVLGDNASTPYSGMAQTAIRDGQQAAENIIRKTGAKKQVPYRAIKPVYITPVGPRWSAVLWGRVRLTGRLGWLVRRLADWLAYREFEPWWKASKQWLAANELSENCPYCMVGSKEEL